MWPATHERPVPYSMIQVESDHFWNPSLTLSRPKSGLHPASQQRVRKPRKFVKARAKQFLADLAGAEGAPRRKQCIHRQVRQNIPIGDPLKIALMVPFPADSPSSNTALQAKFLQHGKQTPQEPVPSLGPRAPAIPICS